MPESYEDKLKREKQERKQREEDNLVVAQTVAILLGGVVKPCNEDREYCNYFPITFDNTDEITLTFDTYGYKGKVHVSGRYATNIRNTAASINVSDKKTPQQIARDIERRFMPEYRKAAQEAKEQKQRQDDYAAAQDSIKDELCAVPGVRRSTYNNGVYINTKTVTATIQYVGSDRASITVERMTLSVDKLLRLLKEV